VGLQACCLAGLGINYMTTFAWGLGKTWYKKGGDNWSGVSSDTADNITLTYDLTKGVLQFIFGFYSDRSHRRPLIIGGLCLNAVSLVIYALVGEFATSQSAAEDGFFFAAFLLGLGTAMMYAVVIAAVAESADPSWRASAVGSYRFWRDSGYAIGGLLLGYVSDQSGMRTAIVVSAFVMAAIAFVFFMFYEEVVESEVDMQALNSEFSKDSNVTQASYGQVPEEEHQDDEKVSVNLELAQAPEPLADVKQDDVDVQIVADQM